MLKTYERLGTFEIGVDEVGRGCLMGPVVAAAVVLPVNLEDPLWKMVKDSKKVSAKKRDMLNTFIRKNAIAYGIGIVSEKEVDRINILQATYKAMHQALDACITRLQTTQTTATNCTELQAESVADIEIYVDGSNFKPYLPPGVNDDVFIPFHCIVNGDNTYLNIAAASIVAKTERDTIVQELVKNDPSLDVYGISKNMGYGTKVHMDALKLHGPTIHHRRSFRPVRESER